MADDDQQQKPIRYWFPYWSRPPPSRPPPVRPQLSRRLSPPVAPSSPQRPPSSQHHQPTMTAAEARGTAPPPPQAPQVSRPSPSRASPLAPIREPPPPSNSNAGAAAAPAKSPSKAPVAPPAAAREAAPKLKDVDIVIPLEKPAVQQPAAAEIKPHDKAPDKEHKALKEKQEKKDETKSKKEHKEKEKEKEEKEKEKEKEKKHHESDDTKLKQESKVKQGKLHGEIKASVADMVHKASAAAAGGGSGHGHGHERAAGSTTSVITLGGENKGPSMKVGGAKDDGAGASGNERHGRKLVDGNEDGKKAAELGRGSKPGTMRALVNSNVQVINNSLLLQSSCDGGDPGVHLKLSAKSKSKDKQRQQAGGDDKGAKK